MSDKITNYFIWLIMSGMLGYFFYIQGWIFADFQNLSTSEANYLIENDKNITVVDVRSKQEYKKDYIKSGINIPSSELEHNLSRIEKFKETRILLYSERGDRSIDMARLLSKNGFTVLNLKGGMVFWIRKGYVVSRP